MRPKKYTSPNRITIIVMMFMIVALLAFGTTVCLILADDLINTLLVVVVLCIFFPTLIYVAFYFVLPAYAPQLIILEDRIIWKCLLHKTLQMDFDECIYVGIEDSSINLGRDKPYFDTYGRGDEYRFIYLSSNPIPQKYIHKASSATPKKGFITFPYTDEVCQALIEALPTHKTGKLVSFYNSLQLADRKRAKEKEQKKKAKLKKKIKNKRLKKIPADSAMSNIKPIFGTDITYDKKNEIMNGAEFISKTSSLYTVEEIEADMETLEQTEEASKLPLWVRVIKVLCGFYGFTGTLSSIRGFFEVGFSQAMQNAPVLIISAFISLIIFYILHIISKKKEVVVREEDVEQQIEKMNRKIEDIFGDMDVPSHAVSTDILTFRYSEKKGIICPEVSFSQITPYANPEFRMFVRDDCLHLANLQNVYSFKLSELIAIKTVNKQICIPSWNKTDDPRKGEFKPYKMTVNNFGFVFFRPYHILEIEHNGQLFGIYFPCYELETFEKFSELKAQKQ